MSKMNLFAVLLEIVTQIPGLLSDLALFQNSTLFSSPNFNSAPFSQGMALQIWTKSQQIEPQTPNQSQNQGKNFYFLY